MRVTLQRFPQISETQRPSAVPVPHFTRPNKDSPILRIPLPGFTVSDAKIGL